MPSVRERAWPLLSLLYAAPSDTAAAAALVKALGREISEHASVLGLGRVRDDDSGVVVAFGVDGSRKDAVELALPVAEARHGIDGFPAGAVFEIPGDDPGFQESPLYRKLLRPLGVRAGPGLGVVLERSEARVTLVFVVLATNDGWQPSAPDRELLECLAPHILQSLRLHERIMHESTGTNALVAAFDQLVLGVVLLDKRGRVTFANESAAAVLGVERGLSDPEHMARDVRTAALGRLLIGERGPRLGMLVLRHPEDDRPLQIFSTALVWDSSYGEAARRFATAVFIGDSQRFTGDPIGILGALYGLTPSEARLALLLVADRSIDQAARHLGVALSTARTALKGVFAKTGTNRQASLVRLLLTGPGQLRVNQIQPLPDGTRRAARAPEVERPARQPVAERPTRQSVAERPARQPVAERSAQ